MTKPRSIIEDLKNLLKPVSVELPQYRCCNHCFFEDGQLSHDRSMLDKHTVPCNEPFCSQGDNNASASNPSTED